MNDGRFLPNSPCLVNAGYGGGLFACFVIGMEDSLDSISQAKEDAMAITKAGGGWGIGLSSLRPAGSPVSGSTHGIAGGPIGFWETFSRDAMTMTQGGFRDAACMATMRVDHPDIMEFIFAKTPINSVIGLLNLDRIYEGDDSTSAALRLLEVPEIARAAETYLSNFNISVLLSDDFMQDVINGNIYKQTFDGKSYGSVSASYVFDAIAKSAWSNGEPGVLFIDTIKSRTKYDPDLMGATNPCGEQPLPPNGSCCLGSINLSAFVNDDGTFDDYGYMRTIGTAVRFLDNMITLNEFPTEATREWSLANRSIGLGLMGYADALVKLGYHYGSGAALEIAEWFALTLRSVAEAESELLCQEKGPGTIGDFNGRRNNAVTSIAPTGTISLLAGCSSGIEPIFSKTLSRNDKTGSYIIEHPLAQMEAFVTLDDLDWKNVVDTVAVFSEEIDTSISYTLNMPNDATVEDVKEAIVYAWEKRCNGCTIYRDGSRQMQVLSDSNNVQTVQSAKRPLALDGKTYKYAGVVNGESTNLYVTVNSDKGRPWEVFVNTPYIKSMDQLQLVTAVTRLTSMSLRYGAPPEKIIEQLLRVEGQSVSSIPAIIARALTAFSEIPAGDCPDCGGEMAYQGGCAVCNECGFSRCG